MPRSRSGFPLIAVLVLGLLGAGFASARTAAAGESPPSSRRIPDGAPSKIVLVTVDALRADHVSFLGHRPQTTPFLDSLARSSVVFTGAHSTSSWTVPGMVSLFTSLAPSSHGLVKGIIDPKNPEPPKQQVFPASFHTLAEAMQEIGYLTIGVPSNLNMRGDLGFAQGFKYYFGRADYLDAAEVNAMTLQLVQKALGRRWREHWKTRPAFLWLHYFDPHDPYLPRHPWIRRFAPDWDRDSAKYLPAVTMPELMKRFPRPDAQAAALLEPLYDSEIAFFDDHFRQLSDSLALAGDDVLLIVTADHGEEFAEHGGLGHMRTLYDESVRIPLLVRWPRVLGPRTVATPVSLLDIYPTLLELTGEKIPREHQGQSLARLLRGERPDEDRAVYAELYRSSGPLTSVRQGDWKLIRNFGPDGRRELYNLRDDPSETRDLADGRPETVQVLRELLMRWHNALPQPPADLTESPITDPELLERMRSLGYVN